MRHCTFLRHVGSRSSSMKRKAALGAAALVCGATVCAAAADETVTTRLVGYQETPQTINSAASGEFKATIHDDGTAIDYEVTYRNLSSPPLQSHIHFGRPGLNGGVVLFLCTNLTPPVGVPTPPACPAPPATVTGTGQNPKFAPDLKQIGQMKLKGLLPNSNNPSSAVSGILGGMLGQKGPASTPTATATAATESGRANHQHFREEKTAAAGTPAPAEMMRLAAYCLISKHTNRNDLSNQDILAL